MILEIRCDVHFLFFPIALSSHTTSVQPRTQLQHTYRHRQRDLCNKKRRTTDEDEEWNNNNYKVKEKNYPV